MVDSDKEFIKSTLNIFCLLVWYNFIVLTVSYGLDNKELLRTMFVFLFIINLIPMVYGFIKLTKKG